MAELPRHAQYFSVFFIRALLVSASLSFPVAGYCDSGNGWVGNLFESKGKSMKEVAVKVAELPEKESINVRALDFSADGKYLAVDSAFEAINIWDWQAQRIVRTVEKAQGANNSLATEKIRYSPDGHLLAACHSRAAGDIVARIWNTGTWEVERDIVDPIPGGCYSMGFTPDGKALIRVSSRNPQFPADDLIVYNTGTWQSVWGLRTLPFYPKALAISPDGKFAAIGGEVLDGIPIKRQIIIVDIAQRAIVRTIPKTAGFDFGQLAWHPDGAHLAAATAAAVQVFDMHSETSVADEHLNSAHMSLRYSPDGKYLIEGDMNGKGTGLGVKIWDGQHRELLQEIPGNVGSLAVSRDGHYLATGVDKKTIIWQLK